MDICSSGHEEIVYIEKHCPLCEALDKIKDLEREVEELHNEINSLEEKLP